MLTWKNWKKLLHYQHTKELTVLERHHTNSTTQDLSRLLMLCAIKSHAKDCLPFKTAFAGLLGGGLERMFPLYQNKEEVLETGQEFGYLSSFTRGVVIL